MESEYVSLSKDEPRDESDLETNEALDQHVPNTELKWKRLNSPLIIFTFLSVLIIFALGSLAGLQDGSSTRNLPTPQLPIETLIFQNYSEFSSNPTTENNALWMDLLGPGMGFVNIENPSQYGLPDGISYEFTPPGVQVYGISMYHQLHCLMMIRDGYWAALRGERNLKMIEAHGTELLKDVHHVNHCFDYIRQAIMCAGDMSIEGVAPPETADEKPHINGYGNRHECKGYQASRDWMDARVPAKEY